MSSVVDHLRSRVVWVGEGKSEETLNAFFDELGEERTKELTHATMDLSAAFSKAVSNRAPHVHKVFDRFHVQKLANEALNTVRRQEVRVNTLAKTVKRHKEGILAYVETGLSNGVVEGINNKIRAIIRRAYGLRNPKALRAMIMLCCGGLEFTPPLPVAA